MAEDRQWAGMMGRAAKKAALNLGIVAGAGNSVVPKHRSDKLERLEKYYENEQYDHLLPWDKTELDNNEYVPIRKRKPRIIYAFAKMLCQRVASKLVGASTFPKLIVEDDPDTTQFLALILKMSGLQSKILEPIRQTLAIGSSFIRFYFVNGQIKIEHFEGNYCYPEFEDNGELKSIRIQYTYEDPIEKDERGNPLCKWYRLDLDTMSDTLFDNPVYRPNANPEFQVVSKADHGLGFVQGAWLRTSEDKHEPDGYSLIEDLTGFIDELCYSLSQSSTAVSYNQDPQLAISGMDSEELDTLIRSSSKAWNLGRNGKAAFLESNLNGVKMADDMRDKMKMGIQDVARVVMLDPEKFSAQAMSGKAMEVLHGPLVELINELRPVFEPIIISLLIKISITTLILKSQGVDVGLEIPEGWQPSSFNIIAQWPAIFPQTMQDLKEKVGVGVAVSSANIFSRETITRWLAKDFDVEDIEGELAKIAAQPVINPFGGF